MSRVYEGLEAPVRAGRVKGSDFEVVDPAWVHA